MLRGNAIATELARYIAARPKTAFDWQAANCCHFAAGWIEHATGVNPMADLPATPDAMAAVRLVREHGDLQGIVTAATGWNPIPPALAQTGDIVLVESADPDGTGHAIGICSGHDVLVTDAQGLVQHGPMDMALCAWRLA